MSALREGRSAVLTRLESGDQGTFGELVTDGGLRAFTGELPWRDNRSNVSCVPTGSYLVVFNFSPAFRRQLYLLTGTGHRTGIRVHAANLMGDVEKGFRSQLYGCVALGRKLGTFLGQRAVLVSEPAVRELHEDMGRGPFTLEIRDA